VVELLSRDIIL